MIPDSSSSLSSDGDGDNTVEVVDVIPPKHLRPPLAVIDILSSDGAAVDSSLDASRVMETGSDNRDKGEKKSSSPARRSRKSTSRRLVEERIRRERKTSSSSSRSRSRDGRKKQKEEEARGTDKGKGKGKGKGKSSQHGRSGQDVAGGARRSSQECQHKRKPDERARESVRRRRDKSARRRHERKRRSHRDHDGGESSERARSTSSYRGSAERESGDKKRRRRGRKRSPFSSPFGTASNGSEAGRRSRRKRSRSPLPTRSNRDGPVAAKERSLPPGFADSPGQPPLQVASPRSVFYASLPVSDGSPLNLGEEEEVPIPPPPGVDVAVSHNGMGRLQGYLVRSERGDSEGDGNTSEEDGMPLASRFGNLSDSNRRVVLAYGDDADGAVEEERHRQSRTTGSRGEAKLEKLHAAAMDRTPWEEHDLSNRSSTDLRHKLMKGKGAKTS